MALRFDLSGNPLPGPVDRLRSPLVRRSAPAATDPRGAEINALKARIAELEEALSSAKLALTASVTVPSSATASAKKIKTAPNNISAKLKDEPWMEMGLSRRTYYRRKAAGTL